jgi:hypothetical protein
VKTVLQSKVYLGEIGSMAELLSYIADQRWDVMRNGADYLVVKDGFGKRFRVRFHFSNDTQLGIPNNRIGK